ncbi:MAG: S9 family peptidase [Candidatus Latescibacterota bacterium]|nr:MAG: S9 family peptidase [Candidatus Latescibacterota bacterium]
MRVVFSLRLALLSVALVAAAAVFLGPNPAGPSTRPNQPGTDLPTETTRTAHLDQPIQADQSTKPDESAPEGSRKVLTVDRIFSTPSLTGSAPSGIRWLPDSKGISFIETEGEDDESQSHFIVAKVPSGDKEMLCVIDTITVPADLKQDDDDSFGIGAYQWAETGDLMSFLFRDEIFTFNRKTREVVRRTKTDVAEENVTFSPNGEKIAFTRENDLWVIDLHNNEEKQLTTTGSDTLLNGVLDWVYMEELFTRGNVRAYWWSPDNEKIAYMQFDVSPVPQFPIVDFLPLHNTTETQRYPKAGDPNSIVRVGVIDVSSGEMSWMKVDTMDDSYIARVYWVEDNKHLAVEKLNRNQTELRLLIADVETGDVTEALTETSDAWVNVNYMRHYFENKDRFVWNSERDGFSHLYLYKTDGTLVRQLTSGSWDVSRLNGVDEKNGFVYFTALEKSILERHLYRVSEKGGEIKRITDRPGTHSVTFSPDLKYYIDRFSNTTTPRVITVHKASGKKLFKIDECDTSELDEYELPAPEIMTFTSGEGVTFYASMIKPPDFDPKKKYPVIVYTYGFPRSQIVRNAWGRSLYLWHAMMATRGYIVFSMDNRGTFGHGRTWEDQILGKLGQLELEDQVAGAEFLKSLPYVDGSRLGIWGWSGGGTMTTMAMLKKPGLFKAGAAVAPVTDFRFYDSIYTERYMKSPDENEDGYHESAPADFADALEGALLLVHGTADDNVHMQNSMHLVRELIVAGKDFDLMVYPGGRHGIGGDTERAHLFKKMTNFFVVNL